MLTQEQHAEAATFIEQVDRCGDTLEEVLDVLNKFLNSGKPYYAVLDRVYERITVLNPSLETVAWVWQQLQRRWQHFPDDGYGFWDTELYDEDYSIMNGTAAFSKLWTQLSDEAVEKVNDFYSALNILRIASHHSIADQKVRELASTQEHVLAWLEYKCQSGCSFCGYDEEKILKLATTDRVRHALLSYWGVSERTKAQLRAEIVRNLPAKVEAVIVPEQQSVSLLSRLSNRAGKLLGW